MGTTPERHRFIILFITLLMLNNLFTLAAKGIMTICIEN